MARVLPAACSARCQQYHRAIDSRARIRHGVSTTLTSTRHSVLPGGADWTLQHPDGAIALDLRITLETHDAALVFSESQNPR